MYARNVVKQIGALIFVIAITMGLTMPAQSVVPPSSHTTLLLNESDKFQKNPYVLLDQFVRDVNAAPKGSMIRIATYLWDTDRATDALIRAYKRGVMIHMVIDPTQHGAHVQKLEKVLGKDKTKSSFLYHPIGSGLVHKQYANIHAKVITISQSSGNKNISYNGSANLAVTNLRASANETQRYVNNRVLYLGNARYVDAIIANKQQPHYYSSKYGRVRNGSVSLYFYPGAPDIINNRLNDFNSAKTCKGVRIDVAIFQISDATSSIDKAKSLLAAAKAGCDVNFIYNYKPSRNLIGVKPAKYLFAKRTTGSQKGQYWISLRNGRTAGQYVHNKETLIKTPKGTQVYAGSSNWLGMNRKQNADFITVNTDPNIYNLYLQQWGHLWTHGTAPVFPNYDPGIASSDHEEEYDSDE